MPGYNFKNFVQRGENEKLDIIRQVYSSFQILFPKRPIICLCIILSEDRNATEFSPVQRKKAQKMFCSAQTFSSSKEKNVFFLHRKYSPLKRCEKGWPEVKKYWHHVKQFPEEGRFLNPNLSFNNIKREEVS